MKRRDFVKLLGSSVAFGAIGASFPSLLKKEEVLNNIDKYQHIVVLMLENRSFDNMLGYLYQPGELPPGVFFNGVAGKNLKNPVNIPDTTYNIDSVGVYPGTVMTDPDPDPGEEYPHINTQLFNTIIPDTNKFLHVKDMLPPYNEPFPLPFPATMNGFVNDYIYYYKLFQGRYPTVDEFKIVMACFPPTAVPVISALAKGFAVCDNWVCSVPSQTFCNRSFFNAASSWGYVNNSPSARWALNLAPTMYNRLQDANIPWKVYFDVLDILPATLLLHFFKLRDYIDKFHYMSKFYDDVKNGNLPAFCFVEPRMHWFHNDEHPPDEGPRQNTNFPGPSNVLAGEQLIHNIYTAIKESNSPNGSNYQNTLLIITYDEHGGCYDHVPPRMTVPPYDTPPYLHKNENDFTFNRTGLRVPTVLVSSYIAQNTIVNTEFEHTSVYKTLSEKYGLPNLTNRDLLNPHTLNSVFNLNTPRTRDTWPVTKPRPLNAEGDKDFYNTRHLHGLKLDMILLAKHLAGLKGADPVTILDGIEMLMDVKERLGIKFPEK
ncbi:MAG: hypothetical protein IAE65_07145 [Ignavibacteria bacterium]|nr:hypothetical protein [Ignavibacteria bacterium]